MEGKSRGRGIKILIALILCGALTVLFLIHQPEANAFWEDMTDEEDSVSGDEADVETRPGRGTLLWPSNDTYMLSSEFGPRESPGDIGSTFHLGIDIPAAQGTYVLAAADGYVVASRRDEQYGNYIRIRHGVNYYTLYAHMSHRHVLSGEYVTRGQVIGLVGSTGISTGPHIHFELIIRGRWVDPMRYFAIETDTDRCASLKNTLQREKGVEHDG